MPNALRALRSRNYRLFFAGQAISLVGMWMQLTAQSWLMYRITDSALAVAVLGAAQTGPGLLVGPIAGALADRHDRRRLLLLTQAALLVPSFLLAGLTLAGWIGPLQLALLSLATGVIRACEIPARQAFVSDIVARPELPAAISLNSALFHGARMLGPAAAGVAMALANEGWCFLVNAISYFGPIAALLALRLPAAPPRARSGRGVLAEIFEGIGYVRREPLVGALLGNLALISVVGMPYSVVLPALASGALAGESGTFSAVTSAAGAGATVSALLLAMRSGSAGLERIPALGGAAVGAALLLLSQANSMLLALPVMAAIGAGLTSQNTATNTLLQLGVPDELRGRVMSIHSALFLGVVPVGGLAWGVSADAFGAAPTLAVAGILLLLGSAIVGRRLARLAARSAARSTPPPAPPLEPDTPRPL